MPLLEEILDRKINYIFSKESEEEWQDMRECMEDDTLLNSDRKTYILHMQAVHLELLGSAYTKTLGGGLAMLLKDPLKGFEMYQKLNNIIRQREEYTSEIDETRRIYNSAYGSSPTKGIEAMAREFNNYVANGQVPNTVIHSLTEYFTSTWQNCFTVLSSAMK